MATTDLIVDFPHQRNDRAVHFDETAQLHTFERQNVARHELYYTSSEYDHMQVVRREDVLAVRSGRTLREAVDDHSSTEESVCLMGIEHLLTPACIREVRACRARCIRAVLTVQARARQGPSPGFVWQAIAPASRSQTWNAKLRAKKLGEIHRESI